MMLATDQKRRVEQLTSLFENGTTVIQYGYVENLNDGRGYTCGRAGFTTGTGDCLEVIQRFTKQVPNNPLAKYISELKRIDTLPEDSPKRADVTRLQGFPQAWKSLANNKQFQAAQDSVVEDWYLKPALSHADQVGLKTALGGAIFYDSIIQHGDGDDADGLPALIALTQKKMGGTPKTGIDERRWLSAFLDVRRADLAHAHNPDTREEWAQSVSRVDTLRQLLISGNLNLNKSFIVTWEGDHYTIQ